MVAEKDGTISKLVMLDVPDDELVSRLLERGKSSGRKDDANEEVIRNRLAVYYDNTAPVYGYYDGKEKALKIDGTGSIDDVFGRLCGVIDGL
ncbi:MAG: nucleoside monophosphate kinase [Bacteroidota bacterium]